MNVGEAKLSMHEACMASHVAEVHQEGNATAIYWRALRRAQINAVRQPIALMHEDGKRPDGTTILPWSRDKLLAWDVTLPDIYADAQSGKQQQPIMPINNIKYKHTHICSGCQNSGNLASTSC